MKTDIKRNLQSVMEKHHRSCDWKEGNAVRYFVRDGFPCVQYESGAWWHYDTVRGTWF